MLNKIFLYLIFIFIPFKNGILLNTKEINLSDILSYKYIYIHHPWNKISQVLYKLIKKLSLNNTIIIDIIHLLYPELFLKNLFIFLNNNISNNETININFPILIKSINNHVEIYNNNPSPKKMKKFLDIKKNN